MKPTHVHVDESAHPMIEVGLYTFEEFEQLACTAANMTPSMNGAPTNQSCVEITAYFEQDFRIYGHLHIANDEDYGLMDWIGNCMATTNDPQLIEQLSQINRTLH